MLFAAAALSLAAPAAPVLADGHGSHAEALSLTEVLAHERRDGDRARDQYRNPAETLAFFQVEPDMTVAEVAPGGGWYTRILAPYLAEKGQYIAIARDSDAGGFDTRAARARALGWTERFKQDFAEEFGGTADEVMAFEVDEFSDELSGSIDRILIVRALHGVWNGGDIQLWMRAMREVLAEDGMVGIVQHRAPADATYADVNPARGYMREADMIKLMEISGFELVAKSEINANPNDTADHPEGVWEMKPVWRTKRPELENIGESDRMTLLFKKAD
ncbi:MAG: class I SAM-dependent methyltransferase [Altererythrobacter sp.]|nr:class I SAM-dependent methyltransferase [Altererythrobacter sp.]